MTLQLNRLTNRQLNQILKHSPFPERSREIMKAVLVDGKGLAETGKEFGCTKQNVAKLVKKVKELYEKQGDSEGLVKVSLVIPESVATELVGYIEDVNKCKNKESVSESQNELVKSISKIRAGMKSR